LKSASKDSQSLEIVAENQVCRW